jgi:predicted lipid-binding transport protein (Tim44 family)
MSRRRTPRSSTGRTTPRRRLPELTPARRRRLALIALIVLVLGLIVVPTALAAGGSGSAGFSGGGGDGGGGGGGGKGFAIYIIFQLLFRIALLGHGLGALVLVAILIVYLVMTRVAPGTRNFWSAKRSQGPAARRQTAQRQRRVEAAAAEAAEDDPAFAPEVVREQAAALYIQIQKAWDAHDTGRLQYLVGPDLYREWERRLDDFDRKGWRNHVRPLDDPRVEYVGLVHRGDNQTDRVTVRIEAKLRDYVVDRRGQHIKRVGQISETVRLREFWTLGRRENRWILVSIEQGAEGAHGLTDQIVATPWSDDQSLHDEALVEQAVADSLPDDVKPAEVADLQFDGDARAAALDLSLADARFAPDVLEVAARRAVAAWAEAIDGDDKALNAIADREAADQMLHPGDPGHTTRLVIRGPTIKQIRITGLDAAASPPLMEIDVEIEGRRYIEDRDTAALISGNRSKATSFTEHWTLALSGDGKQPWRIARAANPVLSA